MDISKTQFLVDNEGQVFRSFRRRRALVLFNASGVPMRVVPGWRSQVPREDWENIHTCWVLVPLP